MQWLLWLRSALSRSLMFLVKGAHVFIFTKLPWWWSIFDLPMSHFDSLISSDSLIFLLLYVASFDNVFKCSQLNWPWDYKKVFHCTWTFPFSLYAVFLEFNCSGHHFFLCFTNALFFTVGVVFDWRWYRIKDIMMFGIMPAIAW